MQTLGYRTHVEGEPFTYNSHSAIEPEKYYCFLINRISRARRLLEPELLSRAAYIHLYYSAFLCCYKVHLRGGWMVNGGA